MSVSEPTVFIVDDDAAVQKSLASLLQEEVGIKARLFSDAKAFLEAYDPRCPGCMVLDVRMPGMSGLELQAHLKERGSRIPILVVTGHGDIAMAVEAMKVGALDFIEKPYRDQVMLENIRQALEVDTQNRLGQDDQEAFRGRFASLTERQRELIPLLLSGKTSKEIAVVLNISQKTVDFHRAHIFEHLEVNSVLELYQKAEKHGLTSK